MESPEINNIDPTIGSFKFLEADRKRMLEEGMTEQQINEKEADARKKIAKNQLEQEIETNKKDLAA